MIRFLESVDMDDIREKAWYVGTVYTRHPKGIHIAHAEACRATAQLMLDGILSVYSPIVDSHCLAMIGGIDPMDHDLWIAHDEWEMTHRDGMIIVMMDGWKESVGLKSEAKVFKAAGKPILHMVWP